MAQADRQAQKPQVPRAFLVWSGLVLSCPGLRLIPLLLLLLLLRPLLRYNLERTDMTGFLRCYVLSRIYCPRHHGIHMCS